MARLAVSAAISDIIIIIVETTTVFCITKALVSMISVQEKKKNQLKEQEMSAWLPNTFFIVL